MNKKLFTHTTSNEILYLSRVLSEWIRFRLNKKELFINENCLYWQCLYINEVYKNWNSLNKNFPNEISRKLPIELLITINQAYESTGFYPKIPTNKYFFTPTLDKIIKSLKTTFNLFLVIFKKREIVLNQNLGNYLNKEVLHLRGEIIFSNLVIKFLKRKTRNELRIFLLNKNLKYDIDILVNLIPEYLVELLPLYHNISKRINLKKIHAWVMDIYACPLLLNKCILTKNLEIIGYQHGGSYGFYQDIMYKCEINFYSRFIYWGFTEKDTSPFRFGLKEFKTIYKEDLKINIDNKITDTNIITERQDAIYATSNQKINNLASKLIIFKYKCNLFLHPFDSSYTLNSFEAVKNFVSFFKGIDKSHFKKSSINFTSIYSTLFWELLYYRIPVILYYPDEHIPDISYNKFLIQTLEDNNLLFSISVLNNLINKEFIEQSLLNNYKFYSDIRKHIFLKNLKFK